MTGASEVVDGVSVLPLVTPTLPPAEHTNAVLHAEARLVFDPGSPWPHEHTRAIAWIEKVCGKLSGVVLTHHHRDHIGAAVALSAHFGCPIFAHTENAAWLPNLRFEALPNFGTWRGFRLFHTPGHAPGHVAFYDDARGVAVAGDMVAGIGTILIDPYDGDMQQYLSSLQTLAENPITHVIPAHGNVLPHAVFAQTHAHRLARESRVVRALDASNYTIDFAELLADVYSDTPQHIWPLALRSLESHLRKLETERTAGIHVANRPRIKAAFDM